jgi:hypothetical protein
MSELFIPCDRLYVCGRKAIDSVPEMVDNWLVPVQGCLLLDALRVCV